MLHFLGIGLKSKKLGEHWHWQVKMLGLGRKKRPRCRRGGACATHGTSTWESKKKLGECKGGESLGRGKAIAIFRRDEEGRLKGI